MFLKVSIFLHSLASNESLDSDKYLETYFTIYDFISAYLVRQASEFPILKLPLFKLPLSSPSFTNYARQLDFPSQWSFGQLQINTLDSNPRLSLDWPKSVLPIQNVHGNQLSIHFAMLLLQIMRMLDSIKQTLLHKLIIMRYGVL